MPEELGLKLASIEDLRGGSAEVNAEALTAVLEGARTAYRDIAALNAAAALVVGGAAATLQDGLLKAQSALDSGAAKGTLAKLIEASNA